MSDSLEYFLRKSMETLGAAVESVIGKAKKATMQVGSRTGVQPILSIESLLDPSRQRDIINESSEKFLESIIPDLKGMKAAEIGEGPAQFGALFSASNAELSAIVEIGGGSVGTQGRDGSYVLRAAAVKLPFPDSSFGYVVARMATALQGDLTKAIKEVSRVMRQGGQGVLFDFHPFGLFAKKGLTRVRPPDSGIHRLEDYYKVCRRNNLRVVDVREIFVDEAMKQLFTDKEMHAYRSLKGTPLILALIIYKPKGANRGS